DTATNRYPRQRSTLKRAIFVTWARVVNRHLTNQVVTYVSIQFKLGARDVAAILVTSIRVVGPDCTPASVHVSASKEELTDTQASRHGAKVCAWSRVLFDLVAQSQIGAREDGISRVEV